MSKTYNLKDTDITKINSVTKKVLNLKKLL